MGCFLNWMLRFDEDVKYSSVVGTRRLIDFIIHIKPAVTDMHPISDRVALKLIVMSVVYVVSTFISSSTFILICFLLT